ncbi:hypothetical protein PR048_014908 [Dryococelus australis]|uniref:Transposase Tc1-like domain-containing protein n=1 Tax=Dryococelus australis TaxID=614101 RepID=A0ABQ9HFM4_9NEOP|nr:hypothetical protein PR048_014908 [Dryococelus australis]
MKHYDIGPTQFVQGDRLKKTYRDLQGFVYWESGSGIGMSAVDMVGACRGAALFSTMSKLCIDQWRSAGEFIVTCDPYPRNTTSSTIAISTTINNTISTTIAIRTTISTTCTTHATISTTCTTIINTYTIISTTCTTIREGHPDVDFGSLLEIVVNNPRFTLFVTLVRSCCGLIADILMFSIRAPCPELNISEWRTTVATTRSAARDGLTSPHHRRPPDLHSSAPPQILHLLSHSRKLGATSSPLTAKYQPLGICPCHGLRAETIKTRKGKARDRDITDGYLHVIVVPRWCTGQTTRLPSTRNGFDSRRGRSRIFARVNHAGRCRWSAGFLGDLPFSSPCIPMLLHTHLTFIGSQDIDVKIRRNLSAPFKRIPRKKPYISEVNRKKRLAFAKEYCGKPREFWDTITFSDESKFNVSGSNGRKKNSTCESGCISTTCWSRLQNKCTRASSAQFGGSGAGGRSIPPRRAATNSAGGRTAKLTIPAARCAIDCEGRGRGTNRRPAAARCARSNTYLHDVFQYQCHNGRKESAHEKTYCQLTAHFSHATRKPGLGCKTNCNCERVLCAGTFRCRSNRKLHEFPWLHVTLGSAAHIPMGTSFLMTAKANITRYLLPYFVLVQASRSRKSRAGATSTGPMRTMVSLGVSPTPCSSFALYLLVGISVVKLLGRQPVCNGCKADAQ